MSATHSKGHHQIAWVFLQVTSPPPKCDYHKGLRHLPRACMGDVADLGLSFGIRTRCANPPKSSHTVPIIVWALAQGNVQTPSNKFKTNLGVSWVHLGAPSIRPTPWL